MAIAKAKSDRNVVLGGCVTSTGENASGNYRAPTDRVQIFSNIDTLSFTEVLGGRHLAEAWADGVDRQSANFTNIPSSANSNAVVVFSAEPNRSHVIGGVSFGYNSTPVGGSGVFKIESPSGTIIYHEYVTSAGPNSRDFDEGLKGARGSDMLVYLLSGGTNVKGSVTAFEHSIE